jgi:hypothetical protein
MSVPNRGTVAVPLQTLVRLLADYKLVDRNDPIVTMLAKLVIELVRDGERDPERIRQKVLGKGKLVRADP